ncbi:hypothetical protein BC830DRAFT_1083377 [Chytriomyces sp. MP71]|nr:hypothetical protein BC830DRAFT_1083377 [Chytriomyces sp. MP71]
MLILYSGLRCSIRHQAFLSFRSVTPILSTNLPSGSFFGVRNQLAREIRAHGRLAALRVPLIILPSRSLGTAAHLDSEQGGSLCIRRAEDTSCKWARRTRYLLVECSDGRNGLSFLGGNLKDFVKEIRVQRPVQVEGCLMGFTDVHAFAKQYADGFLIAYRRGRLHKGLCFAEGVWNQRLPPLFVAGGHWALARSVCVREQESTFIRWGEEICWIDRLTTIPPVANQGETVVRTRLFIGVRGAAR